MDKCSMLLREIFDLVYLACSDPSVELGLILFGDFLQSPGTSLGLRARMAVDALLKLVGREDVSSSSAVEGLHGVLARALVDIGDESIMPRLVEAARHQSPVVRMCAAQVLGELCGPAAIPTFQELLSDDATANDMWYYENGKGSGGPMMSVSKIAAVSLDHIKTPEAIGLLREYRVTHPRPDSGWGLGHLSIDEEPIKKNPPPPRLTL